MDGYRIVEVGDEFVVFAGDVSVLRCQTQRDAEAVVASALNLLENPNEWWRSLEQRLAAGEPTVGADETMQAAA
jgi:hypothetical protein